MISRQKQFEIILLLFPNLESQSNSEVVNVLLRAEMKNQQQFTKRIGIGNNKNRLRLMRLVNLKKVTRKSPFCAQRRDRKTEKKRRKMNWIVWACVFAYILKTVDNSKTAKRDCARHNSPHFDDDDHDESNTKRPQNKTEQIKYVRTIKWWITVWLDPKLRAARSAYRNKRQNENHKNRNFRFFISTTTTRRKIYLNNWKMFANGETKRKNDGQAIVGLDFFFINFCLV